MNCKPGDLAIVVRDDDFYEWSTGKYVGKAEIAGVVVLCKRLSANRSNGAPEWEVEPFDCRVDGRLWTAETVSDDVLRPIRDNDGEDETLTWAGKPSDIKEPSHA